MHTAAESTSPETARLKLPTARVSMVLSQPPSHTIQPASSGTARLKLPGDVDGIFSAT